MKTSIIAILIAGLVIFGISLVIVKNNVTALSSSDTYSAVIVDCDSKQLRPASRRKAGQKHRTIYAPMAVSPEGHRATGKIWVSGKYLCENMIGSETSILVNRENIEKTRIKSFFQLWLFPPMSLFIFGLVASALLRRTKLAISFLAGLLLLAGTSFAIEFRVFQKNLSLSQTYNP